MTDYSHTSYKKISSLFISNMNNKLIVVITGTNKGIGYDLVKIFLQLHQDSVIYATSR